MGVVGNDAEGQWIKENVPDNRGIIADDNRPTIVKTRIIAHQQQVVRVDLEKKAAISSMIEEQMFNFIQEETYDGILISDYNKGTLTKSLVSKVLASAQEKRIPIITLSQKENIAEIGDYVFRNFITPKMQVETIVSYAIDMLGLSRFAILYPDDKYGTGFMTLFQDEVMAYGGEIVAVEPYNPDQTDFAEPIKTLLEFQNEVHEYPKKNRCTLNFCTTRTSYRF